MNNIPKIEEVGSLKSNKDIFQIIRDLFSLLLKKWLIICVFGIIGGLIGIYFAYKQPATYTSKLTFVVEDGKVNMGGLASLAGQFGFDVGTSSSSLLAGDNVLMFLKSKSLIKEALLTYYDTIGKYSLADRYAEVYELREKWAKNKIIAKNIYFSPEAKIGYSRLQDSLLQIIVTKILANELTVIRPEKKASFIFVQLKTRDEMISKLLCERLVDKATDRYVQSKTKRQKTNVDRLQQRADSIAKILNTKTFANAQLQEKILDVNPGSKTTTVNAEVSTRDKLMLGAIYGEVVKNLEISKVALSQETPTIQIVDSVELPLLKVKTSKTLFGAIGGFCFLLIPVFFYGIKFLNKNIVF